MADPAFTYHDVSIHARLQYQAWCDVCLRWVGMPQDTREDPSLKMALDIHRTLHAKGVAS